MGHNNFTRHVFVFFGRFLICKSKCATVCCTLSHCTVFLLRQTCWCGALGQSQGQLQARKMPPWVLVHCRGPLLHSPWCRVSPRAAVAQHWHLGPPSFVAACLGRLGRRPLLVHFDIAASATCRHLRWWQIHRGIAPEEIASSVLQRPVVPAASNWHLQAQEQQEDLVPLDSAKRRQRLEWNPNREADALLLLPRVK